MKRLTVVFLVFLCVLGHANQYATGLQVPSGWHKKARFSALLGLRIPDGWDWRKQVKHAPPVKNQGSCGSCWAFATSSVMEWQLAIAKKEAVLSPQELVSCDKSSYGCSGGFFTAFNYEVDPGLALEAEYPYKGRNGRCQADSVEHGNKIVSWAYVGENEKAPSYEQVASQIYAGGPVAATVCASGAFMNYRGGIFKGRGNCQNHMITLVGFGVDADNEPYYILQNSWGSSWGEEGYMRIRPNAAGVAQIAAFAVYK